MASILILFFNLSLPSPSTLWKFNIESLVNYSMFCFVFNACRSDKGSNFKIPLQGKVTCDGHLSLLLTFYSLNYEMTDLRCRCSVSAIDISFKGKCHIVTAPNKWLVLREHFLPILSPNLSQRLCMKYVMQLLNLPQNKSITST